jgi:opacity protein-like surface antigen
MRTLYVWGHIVAGLVALAPAAAWSAAASDSTAVPAVASDTTAAEARPATPSSELTYLVPSLEGVGYRVSEGKRQFKNRISFSPGFGQLGNQDLFAFRAGYNPNAWLGYEILLGHNPASSLHALLHTFNVILRYPLPGRVQPYASVGYGMMTVYPGEAINADPVSKNTVTAGGGLELYIRDDVAIRAEMSGATVFGQQLGVEGTVTYAYREYTIGFTFYRSLGM